MKLLNANHIFCMSPHPDDCEYAISGTVKKYKDTKFHILNISQGGRYSSKHKGDVRRKEVMHFWSPFRNVNLEFLEDVFIIDLDFDYFINKIDNILKKNNYSYVMVPPYFDTHQDHRKINMIGESIVRDKKIGLIEYMTPSTKAEWVPNTVIDIGDFVEFKKENLFSSFQSQLEKPYFKKNVFHAFHSSYQVTKRGMKEVEFFNLKSVYL